LPLYELVKVSRGALYKSNMNITPIFNIEYVGNYAWIYTFLEEASTQ